MGFFPGMKFRGCVVAVFALVTLVGSGVSAMAAGGHDTRSPGSFPISLEDYVPAEQARAAELGRELGILEVLALRARQDPFNLLATTIFLLAILHTFLCSSFNKIAHHYEHVHREALAARGVQYSEGKEPVSFRATVFHFLGEVEAVFGIWLIPLFLMILLAPGHGWGDAVAYIDSRNFTEPVFVVVIMAIASSRPVIAVARSCMKAVAGIGKGSPAAWWVSILVVAPLLGSFITEPAAMTIAALLLGRQFYQYHPSERLKYATLGLLFVNVSVGGTLTHFAAPPVLMVATTWHWNLPFMFTHFGWRAVVGIVVSTACYFWVFRRELATLGNHLEADKDGDAEEPVPAWVSAVHLGFLAWTVATLHHPAFFVIGFLFFIAFTQATLHHQYQLALRGPVLVGFFLAGLVVHGGLQGWWISALLAGMGEETLFLTATILTAFNDNAAITYLASQVPAFNPDVLINGLWMPKEGVSLVAAHALEYAVVAGAVTGGGLTVIANAPNPAGQSLLSKFFGSGGISPMGLLLAALFPTVVMAVCFMVLPH
ncbi:MAG: putative Na+/H+ antiporter [Terrimicrobiaceae bacterium]